MTTTAISADPWTVLRGPTSGEAVTAAARALAARHQLHCEHEEPGTLRLATPGSSRTLVTVRFRSVPPQAPRTLGFQVPPPAKSVRISIRRPRRYLFGS
ncbi:hypothetical protein [Streptomyces sp. NPDC002530]